MELKRSGFEAEISFFESDACQLDGKERAEYIARRLAELTVIAAKLVSANWNIWFTITGLAFEPPDDKRPPFDRWDDEYETDEAYEEWVLLELDSLGIYEEIDIDSRRTLDELPDWVFLPW